MTRITPFLWFDKQAEEAATFYTSIFKNSKLGTITRYGKEGYEIHKRPEGSAMTVEFQLEGQSFTALNGGPHFKINPSTSFFVTYESEAEVDALWKQLAEGGVALMELQKYDWSEKYGWVQDRFGVSWQVTLGKKADVGQTITPSLLFVGKQHGRAEEAVKLYSSIFKNSSIAGILRYGANEGEKEGTVKHAQFTLDGNVFMAMDSGLEHAFAFNEAISFVVHCESQEHVDYFWEHLSEGGDEKAQQCGWLKDRFGVSWQVVPTILPKMLQDPDKSKVGRVTNAFLQMKKFDIAALQKAYEGK